MVHSRRYDAVVPDPTRGYQGIPEGARGVRWLDVVVVA